MCVGGWGSNQFWSMMITCGLWHGEINILGITRLLGEGESHIVCQVRCVLTIMNCMWAEVHVL